MRSLNLERISRVPAGSVKVRCECAILDRDVEKGGESERFEHSNHVHCGLGESLIVELIDGGVEV